MITEPGGNIRKIGISEKADKKRHWIKIRISRCIIPWKPPRKYRYYSLSRHTNGNFLSLHTQKYGLNIMCLFSIKDA